MSDDIVERLNSLRDLTHRERATVDAAIAALIAYKGEQGARD